MCFGYYIEVGEGNAVVQWVKATSYRFVGSILGVIMGIFH